MPVDLSIVICTRNRADKLGGMLEALQRLRSDRSWEVILADNNSTDNTPQVLAEAQKANERIRVLPVERTGLGAARDAAWRVAKGDIVLFTDDDCYVAPDLVDAAIDVFADNPEIGFAGGRILLHDPDDFPVTIDERDEAAHIPAREFAPPGVLQGANMAFRRSTLEAIGGIDPMLGAGTIFPCEDIDAVAACVWSGRPGRFDPRMVVRHHHGRKAADFPKLMESYDRGRGAYFAKYLLRGDSRMAYLRGWLAGTFQDLHRGRLQTLGRELTSAWRYLRARRAYGFLLLAAPAALMVYTALALAIGGNKLLRLLSGNRQEARAQ